MVSIHDENIKYEFSSKEELKVKIDDLLEKQVDDKYF